MISRYQGKCANCGGVLPKGSEIDYNREKKKASHVGECPTVESSIEVVAKPPALDKVVAGGSALKMAEARKERYEKIQAQRKANVQERFGDGFMGKVAWFLTESDGPKDTSVSWAKGAEGERVVGAWLDKLAETVQWESSHLLKWRNENGFTKETLPIATALCFVNAEWPLLGGDFWIKNKSGQVAVLWPKKLARYVLEPKNPPFVDVEAVASQIAKDFPKA